MDNQDIVARNYVDLTRICSNICTDISLLADFTQEMLLIVLEMDNEKLEQLHTTRQIKFYFSRVCKNNFASGSSRFYYKYKKQVSASYYYESDTYE